MNTRVRDTMTSIGLLVLRAGVGAYMASHGWGKAQMVVAGKFADFPDPIGIGSAPSLILIAFAELVCAILVAVGLGTRLAAIPPVIGMCVAAFVAHANDPWTAGGGRSKEPALIFAIVFLAIALAGAGRFSLDAVLFGRGRGGAKSSAPKPKRD